MYLEAIIMFIVKFNHKACKYNGISLCSLDKTYFFLYLFMQLGFIFGCYTYLGFTDSTITYLKQNYANSIFVDNIWFLEFIFKSGFLTEIVLSFMLFSRLIKYPIYKMLQLWMIYIE